MWKFGGQSKKDQPLRVIVIGAGEVGFHISQRLAMENKNVVVIDTDPEALRRIAEHIDVQTVEGSGSSPRVLDEAGIGEADILLAVTDSDEINIIACMFANVLSPSILKLARIRNEEYTLYQDALASDSLGISVVINPEVEIVKSIDRLITVPGAVDYSEFAGGRVRMVGVRVECECPVTGTRLMHLRDRLDNVPVVIGAIVRDERLIIPTGTDEIRENDLVYFVCESASLPTVLQGFGCNTSPIKNILIIGGGNIGLRLATFLDRKDYHTRLVDIDRDRCEFLADQLDRTVVLRGDGTDQEFLTEENVGKMDVVISLTGDEESNILSSLLAKSLGAKKTITRINKFAYQPLVRAIGIEHSVSPRLSAINSVLHYVRRGKVLSSVSIKGEEAEAMEAVAQENSEIVGKPIKDINFPKGTLLLCVIREEEVVIPSGLTVIKPQDRVIILSARQNISKVEQALTVKLEYI